MNKTREVRLGLVMYGGVSLAVYIYGVASEFFRLVRGRGIYRLIKALTASDVVVDIMSGSSAGGINGILLSYALSNEREFSSCARLWRNSGDIAKLLRDPLKDRNPVSVLDGEGFYQRQVEHAFNSMAPITPGAASETEDPSEVRELDLFVTGTDLAGNVYTQVDDAGHIIDIKDHRAVFMLQHRRGRKEHFKPGRTTSQALGKLARITSCFPGAFPPVRVEKRNGLDGNFDILDCDARLQLWGNLTGTRVFVDGGVLDNKPFTQTIDAIYYRTTNRAIDRKLFYVEPDPELFDQDAVAPDPDFLKPIVDSLVSIPGYESIADDLRLLQDRNSRIQRFKTLTADAQGLFAGRGLSEKTGVGIPAGLGEPLHSIYGRSRVNSINERAIELLLRGRKGRTLTTAERHSVSSLAKVLADDGLASEIFDAFDVDFRLRRTFQSIYAVYGDAGIRDGGFGLLEGLNAQLDLLKILQWASEGTIEQVSDRWYETLQTSRDPDIQARDTWSLIRRGLQYVLDAGGLEAVLPPELVDARDPSETAWIPQETLGNLRFELGARLRELDRALDGEERPDFESLLLRADSYADKLWTRAGRKMGDDIRHQNLLQQYNGFAYLDAHIFPMEFASGVREKDIIETVRISPVDAQARFSRREPDRKISGDELAHFGGFFRKAWRSNDILWGRLDSLCELTEQLLTGDRVREVVHNDALRGQLRSEVGAHPVAWVEGVFPTLKGSTRDAVADWLRRLVSEDGGKRERALAELETIRDLLIECGQYEIISNDVETVWRDDAEERFDWQNPGHEVEGGLEALDQTINKVQRFNDGTQYPTPMASPLGRYFADQYDVGSEDLFGTIPRLVLLEIAARAGLVVENCLTSVMPSKVASYRHLIRLPLRLLYHLIGFLRRSGRFGSFLFGIGFTGLALPFVLYALGIGGMGFWPAVQFASPFLVLLLVLGALGMLKSRDEDQAG